MTVNSTRAEYIPSYISYHRMAVNSIRLLKHEETHQVCLKASNLKRSFRDFAIAEINVKSTKRRNIRRSSRFSGITADVVRIRLTWRRHSDARFAQSTAQKVSFPNEHHCEKISCICNFANSGSFLQNKTKAQTRRELHRSKIVCGHNNHRKKENKKPLREILLKKTPGLLFSHCGQKPYGGPSESYPETGLCADVPVKTQRRCLFRRISTC